MAPEWMHPALPLLIGTALSLLPGAGWRRFVSLAAPLAALWLLIPGHAPETITVYFANREWILLRLDALGRVFALAFALYGVIAGIYAWNDDGRAAKTAAMAQTAAGVGITLAGDLLTLYLFWELLAVSSLVLIWLGGTPACRSLGAGRRGARGAGFRYLMFHLLGGVVLLGGIVLRLLDESAGAALTALDATTPAGIMILTGVLINAGVPPLHAWLPDAYPRASIFGTVFLAAFTTKSAVYVLARLFPGADLLVWAGAIMALYGVFFAVLENDIRRLLGYHIVSQVGYMVCGVGLGTALAVNGSSAHAFSHIFYKGLLLMSAGAVIHATGRGKLTRLGHLAAPLRLTLIFCMIGAFSISGVPLFNGFISKSMVISAAAESHRGLIELMLVVASMGTFLHTGLKLPWFTFYGKDNGAKVHRPVTKSMTIGMSLAATVCILTGIFPNLLYRLLPHPVEYHPYTGYHVVQILQLLVGTALGFWLLRAKLGGEPTITLDVDRLYRGPLQGLTVALGEGFTGFGRFCDRRLIATIQKGWTFFQEKRKSFDAEMLGRQTTVLCVVLALVVAFLLLARG